MSDNNERKHTHAVYFGSDLVEAGQRSLAVSLLVDSFRKGAWGKVDYNICGDAETPNDQPVMTATLLPPEKAAANKYGLVVRDNTGAKAAGLNL